MRKIAVAVALAACCMLLGGCWFFDAEHNRKHWKVIKRDLMLIHEDLDWILALDKESPLEDYYR